MSCANSEKALLSLARSLQLVHRESSLLKAPSLFILSPIGLSQRLTSSSLCSPELYPLWRLLFSRVSYSERPMTIYRHTYGMKKMIGRLLFD
jgi:hypothetical protein